MAYKERTKSTELQVLESLNVRMELSETEKQHYSNLQRGYEGEVMFDQMTEKLDCDCLILNELMLESNNTLFQIDTTIIFSNTIHIFEVKNYEGDFVIESDRFYMKPKFEINNPLIQLNRTESLFRQLLQSLRFNIPVDASIVFINPQFTLYQSPLNKPFIFPTQIKRYLKQLEKNSAKLNAKHKILADKLISLHIDDFPFKKLPSYDYNQLRKGVICSTCNSFSVTVEGLKCICLDCKYEELVADAVMRSVREFKLLFPNERITTRVIHEWCKIIHHKQRIQRILANNFNLVANNRWSHFEM